MSNTKESLIEQAGGVLEKAYDDIVHPSAHSVGNTLSLLPRTVGVWLGKWEKWIINGEESIKLTAQAVQNKISEIPVEKLSEPEPYVMVPAIQQLSYCYDSKELREMYANLLVSSMNIDTKYNVHPSFVEIIKQLTPDEAKLLKKLSTNDNHPLIDVVLTRKDKGYMTLVHNFTDVGDDVCDCQTEIFSYLDNLERLKLITIPQGIYIKNDEVYKPLQEHLFIKEILNRVVVEGSKIEVKKGKLELTAFGKNFIKVCL